MPKPRTMDSRSPRLMHPFLAATSSTTQMSINVIVIVIGFVQIICCVMFGLHLSGHFQVDGAEVMSAAEETVMETRQKHSSRISRWPRNKTPSAHLPIRPPNPNGKREVQATMVHWNPEQGHLTQLGYHDGRLLVQKTGLYYVYAKTCFRYYNDPELSLDPDSADLGGRVLPTPGPAQLIQYMYLERPSRGSPVRPTVVLKGGSTQRWGALGYHMACQQQGGLVALRAGDALSVNVSNAWMLDPDAEGSYFGAFRIAA